MKLYKSIVLLIISLTATFSASAQQEPTYTLYRYTNGFFNPAAFGLDKKLTLRTNLRSQFIGIANSPETQSFYLNIPVNDKINVGINAINDNVFIENATSLFANFSYILQLNENTELIFGLQAGGTFVNISFDRINLPLDPLFSQNANDFNPNIGAGFYIKNDKYFVSLSSPRLLKTDRIDDKSGIITSASSKLQVYVSGGYHFNLGQDIMFTPSSLVRFLEDETFIDLTGTFKFFNRISLGANYRVDNAFGGLLYLELEDWLEIGYAYETNTSDIKTFEDGTHEIGLAFKF
jgi:type IX secretion system PorP/SprF family membrane protein